MRVIAVLPARNEEKTINEVVRKVREYCDLVYVFDDGSTDRTKFVKRVNGTISNPVNLGKGNTLRGAILWLFWNKILKENDIVILIDSDLQHPPECIPEILEFMKDNDMVVGSRDLSNYPFRKRFGNWFLSKWCSLLAGAEIKDSESGFRAIHVQLLKDILKYSSSRRYAVEMEMNIIAGRLGYKVKFIPVSSSYIIGKGVTVKDGILNAIGGAVCYCKMKMNGK